MNAGSSEQSSVGLNSFNNTASYCPALAEAETEAEICILRPEAIPEVASLQSNIKDFWLEFCGLPIDERRVFRAGKTIDQGSGLAVTMMQPTELAYVFELCWLSGSVTNLVLKIQRPSAEISPGKRARASREFDNELAFYQKELGRECSRLVSAVATGRLNGLPWVLMPRAYGDLFDTMSNAPINQESVFRVAGNILEALCYLHSKGYIHRDVKTENVFSFPDGAKLGDFGSTCAEMEYNPALKAGTQECYPPECMLAVVEYGVSRQNWSQAADIWSFGLLLAELGHCISPQHYLAWIADNKIQCHPSLQSFYNCYRNGRIRQRPLADWLETLTGVSFDRYLGSKTPLLPFSSNKAPWDVQLLLVTLACLRRDPSLRPTAEELREWVVSAQSSQTGAQTSLPDAAAAASLEPDTTWPTGSGRNSRKCCTLQ